MNNEGGTKSPRGFSLIELLVAMGIGVFLTIGIIALFQGTRQSYRATDRLSIVQENARFIFEHMGRNLRQAGYPGNPVGISPPPSMIALKIEGWDGVAGAAPFDPSNNFYVANTDAIRIRHAANTNPTDLDVHSYLYYVGRRSVAEAGLCQNTGLRLFQRNETDGITIRNHEELAENIADMQILYRRQSDTGYIPATGIADWSSATNPIVAVKINLLLRIGNCTATGQTTAITESLVETPMTLPFLLNNGLTAFQAPAWDRRFYQTMTITVSMRN